MFYKLTVKILEVDRTPKVISITVWVHPCGDASHGLRLQPLSGHGFQQNMNLVANKKCIYMFVPKRCNSTCIHVLVGELWKYSCTMGYLWATLMSC